MYEFFKCHARNIRNNNTPTTAFASSSPPPSLSSFSSTSSNSSTAASPTSSSTEEHPPNQKALPKGVVLGKDGKPCRSCTSAASWAAMMASASNAAPPKSPSSLSSSSAPTSSLSTSSTSSSLSTPPSSTSMECPPDVDTLGNHSWTLLHSISASYPPRATPAQQADMRAFLTLFAKLYPCWTCASEFESWMGKPGNAPRVDGRAGLGRWMCEAHNEVNQRLGKKVWDCAKWEERWRTGGPGGECG